MASQPSPPRTYVVHRQPATPVVRDPAVAAGQPPVVSASGAEERMVERFQPNQPFYRRPGYSIPNAGGTRAMSVRDRILYRRQQLQQQLDDLQERPDHERSARILAALVSKIAYLDALAARHNDGL